MFLSPPIHSSHKVIQSCSTQKPFPACWITVKTHPDCSGHATLRSGFQVCVCVCVHTRDWERVCVCKGGYMTIALNTDHQGVPMMTFRGTQLPNATHLAPDWIRDEVAWMRRMRTTKAFLPDSDGIRLQRTISLGAEIKFPNQLRGKKKKLFSKVRMDVNPL